jgi:lipoprotein LpqS
VLGRHNVDALRYGRAARDRGAVTTRRQVGASIDYFRSAATVETIVRYDGAIPRTRWRTAVVLALAVWIVVAGADWAVSSAENSAHGPHALTASLYGGFAVASDHAHIKDGSTPVVPDTFAEAMLPRGTVALIALTLIAVVAIVAPSWRSASLGRMRGPPRILLASESGRVMLTRLCIARR